MRRLMSLIALVALLGGTPTMLLSLGFYRWDRLSLWTASDARVFLAVLTVIGWLAWTAFAVSVLVEIVFLVTGGRVNVRLPGLRGARIVAGSLLAGVIATSAATGALASPLDAAGHQPPSAAATVTPTPKPAATQAAPSAHSDAAPTPEGVRHVVQRGDDLWSLAERYYGSGSEWRQIVQANGDLAADPTVELTAGRVLTIVSPLEDYTVQHGDTLWHLAQERLGDGSRFGELQRLNHTKIDDPDYIETGWHLRLPKAPKAPKAATPASPAAPAPSAPLPAAVPTPSPSASTPPAASPAPAPAKAAAPAPAESPLDNVALRVVLGGLAALAASGLIGRLLEARRDREATRELGETFGGPGSELQRFETALGLAAGRDRAKPPREQLIARAMRLLARHWWLNRTPAPPLERVRVGEALLVFEFGGPADGPSGFHGSGRRELSITWDALTLEPDVDGPVAYPGLVTLGRGESGDLIMVDLASRGVLAVDGPHGDLAESSLAAMALELGCAPWADHLTLWVVTDDAAFVDGAALGRVATEPDPDEAVAEVERLCRDRRALLDLDDLDYALVRLDPDLADAWAPAVFLFDQPLGDELADRVAAALGTRPLGVGAAMPVRGDEEVRRSERLELHQDADGEQRATLQPDGVPLQPQTLPPEARSAIAGLSVNARAIETMPASWWRDYAIPARPTPESCHLPESPNEERSAEASDAAGSGPVSTEATAVALEGEAAGADVLTLKTRRVPPGPRLRLLGPVRLEDARGTPPAKASRRCLEYCAWLLEHPGATASEMTRALFVSDGTRRSNLSRLRAWLGVDADGQSYLPEAYTGRISLRPDVTSDWGDFWSIVADGVNQVPPSRLRQALELVEGAPLADAAPGEWAWAERLRSRMSEVIRDAAVVLARSAHERDDLAGVLWACERGRLAAPDDELLGVELMRAHAALGAEPELRALVEGLERAASRSGRQLRPETVALAQQLLEGQVRPVLEPTGSEG